MRNVYGKRKNSFKNEIKRMSFLEKIPPEKLPDDLKKAHATSVELRGDATFFEVFGNNPKLYRWYVDRVYKELFYAKHLDLSLIHI